MNGDAEKKKGGTKPGTPLREYASLLPFLSRYRWRYLFGLVCLVTVDGAQIIIPQLLRRAVDLISSGNFGWREVVFIALRMVGVMTFISAGRFLWRYFIHGSSRRIETELREKLFGHLLALNWDFYQKNKIGDLMARSINDLNAVRIAIGMGLVALIDFVVMATSILVIIFIQDPRSAALAVIPLPLVTALILFFGGAVGKTFRRVQETYSRMSESAQETFAGIRVVKSFVKEWWFIRKFADTNDDYREANMALVRLFGFFFPFVTFLSELTILIMLLAGGIRVVKGYMSPGSLVAMFRYLQMLIWPLMGAGFVVNMIQRGAVSLSRVNEILRTRPSITEAEKPELPGDDAASRLPAIEVRNLSFSYAVCRPPAPDAADCPGGNALEGISFSLRRGEWLGIMGPTGSGKTTLMKTLVRMLDPPAGTVYIYGVDVKDWPLGALRRLFAVTPQDSYLFSDTIKNNIGYGLEEPEEEALKRASGISSLKRDLETFNEGWDTLIGERGLTLSGGQKQRVALSRSLATGGEFLVLDDSLSAVDAETERRILEALARERKNGSGAKTTIIISHRVSTLRYADRVLVLDGGKAAEYGSVRELASGKGFYARVAALQQLDGEKRNV
ncbi:MAG: ABC transporter ATP-binding protein/permease [Treponema sp.]|jgi:ATP-binding cassette subfamily B protein|nr:ABC transporter ATP-binding protein/permease [Treponema sp.]